MTQYQEQTTYQQKTLLDQKSGNVRCWLAVIACYFVILIVVVTPSIVTVAT